MSAYLLSEPRLVVANGHEVVVDGSPIHSKVAYCNLLRLFRRNELLQPICLGWMVKVSGLDSTQRSGSAVCGVAPGVLGPPEEVFPVSADMIPFSAFHDEEE
mgnify:CR=1